MPYVYIGHKAVFQGHSLFRILCNLKDLGRGRIVYRTIDYKNFPNEVHFYRILQAQPKMDSKTLRGNVVVERVFRNRRYAQPQILSDQVHKTDFRLVSKEEEAAFCQWDQILDYSAQRDAPMKPRSVEMPPLLKEVVRRNLAARGEAELGADDCRLPAHKIYQGDVNLEDRVQSNLISQYISDQYATHKDLDPSLLPKSWNMDRRSCDVGLQRWLGYVEGAGWEEQKLRDEQYHQLSEGKHRK